MASLDRFIGNFSRIFASVSSLICDGKWPLRISFFFSTALWRSTGLLFSSQTFGMDRFDQIGQGRSALGHARSPASGSSCHDAAT